ncbi:3,4-dihydroxy-2-butanone-4-phosphate synthase [Legionella sp. W05-934-2]|jgi:3,4-dihydroxy 2-butanone 4-phosphate synthase/GTP cyclohydrolase II|uniref:3,4-dihydroxy-2-butanone-4-phosphate synthase n=1 Tax=Legionella sp. W05-934-2 TaxID=1198649 RepID=UPI0034625BEA
MTNPFSPISAAIEAMQKGQMIVLLDDEARENEGDLVVAADYATPQAINFMSRFGRGLICLSMAERLIEKLHLPMMTSKNQSSFGTAFTVSIEAAEGVTTGISAQDRARTIAVAIDPNSGPQDVISPGHVFPLKAHPKGVLARQGQTEGSVDLARLAGLTPAAVICEIINEDGTMSRRDQLVDFAEQHNLLMVTIKDLIEYRITHERLIEVASSARLPIKGLGDFTMTVFHNELDQSEHFALVKPPRDGNKVPLVRIHSECITGDVFGSCRCDCGSQLKHALNQIGEEGGVLIYLRQEGRGIGLANKLKAYALQDQGYDTVDANLKLGLPADNRSYAIAYQILTHLGLSVVRLITNNPNKLEALQNYGIQVAERVNLPAYATTENRDYLATKKDKLGHLMSFEE